MKIPLRPAALLFIAALTSTVAYATIGLGLQRPLGNPSGATTSPANTGNFLLERPQMSLSYNNATRDPNWVAWNLTSADVGTVDRSDFLPDPDLPAGFVAVTTTDYNGVGNIRFDRGHMSPSKDRTVTVADNQVVFYMTNIVPQAADNNQGPWAAFEEECRRIADQGNELLIVSGPSGFGTTTIPSGVVFTPANVWKVVVVVPVGPGDALSRINASTRVIALKMPNVNGIRSVPWTDFITSAAEIETDTGYNLFAAIADPALASTLRNKIDGGGAIGTPPVIVSQPSAQTAVVGGSATFTVGATSSTPLTYQWRLDGNEVSGATNAVFTLTNIQSSDAGSYDVQVSNATATVASNPATLTISLPVQPSFTTQPLPQTVLAGANVTFTAIATGVPSPTLQWFMTGSPAVLATTSSLTLTNVQPTDSGTYFAVATNSAGTATSSTAQLTVNPAPPTITTQPASQSISLGASGTLTVAASGSAPLTYQWRKNGTPVAGATTTSLALTNVTATDAGSYDVLVTNGAGSIASSLAVVTITPAGVSAPSTILWTFGPTAAPIATPTSILPANADVFAGAVSQGNNNGTTTLLTSVSVSPTSSGFSGETNAGAAARIGALNTAASGSAYFEFTVQAVAGKQVNITGISFGSRSTNTGPAAFTLRTHLDGYTQNVATGTLTVTSNPWLTYTPAVTPVTSATGGFVTFRLFGHGGAGSPGTGTANWRIDDLRVTATTATPGGTVAPTGAVASTTPAANASSVAINSAIGITFNTPVTVTGSWFALSSALTGPLAATVSGGPTTFTLTPTAPLAHNDTITVQLNAAQITDQATGTGHPTSNYTFSFATAAPTPPAIVTQPLPQSVVIGGSASFSVTATGTAPLTYQWRKNSAPLSDAPGSISGATSNTLTLSNVQSLDAGSYDVVVNNPANSPATSAAVSLNVSATPLAPTIVTSPVAQSATIGGSATFSVVATGTNPLAYQWRKDGAPIAGATHQTLLLTGITTASIGNYDVVVSNGTLPNATSAAAPLTVSTASGLSYATYAGGFYQQKFDTLPSGGTFTFSGNGPFSLDNAIGSGGVGATDARGWSFAKIAGSGANATFRPDTGSNTAGGAVSYGSSGATDRALGSIGSGSVTSRLGLMIVNTSGQTINQLTLRYVGEQWRHGGATTPNKLTFGYAVGAADINTGAFTNAPALDFTAPITASASGALDGNAAANRVPVASALAGLNWAPGQVLVLRWSDVDDSGADDGLAVDDLILTTESLVAPTIALQPVSQTVTFGSPVTFTVQANGTPAPTFQWRKNSQPIAGATNASLTFAAAAISDQGTYTVVVSNLAADVLSAPATLTVNKASATVALGNLAQTYDGTPRVATATTTPANLAVAFTYNGSAIPPIAVGSYAVVATIVDPNYSGSASGTLVVSPATATIAFGGLVQTFDGSPKPVTITTTPAGLATTVTYDGSATAPTNAGTYAVVATIANPNYTGSATAQLVIGKAPASIALSGLTQTYDGTPRVVTAVTSPAGLQFAITYNGQPTAPIAPGSYVVVATIVEPNYSGSTTATLRVSIGAIVRHAPSIRGGLVGSLQVLTGESFALNGNAYISGDLLVPGTPSVRLNGKPFLGGARDGTGSESPSNYTVTLSGNAALRYLVRRTAPIELPVVATPPAPAGTRDVTLHANSAPSDLGDFATLRNLTLNGNAGQVAVPPGTYGAFSANSGAGFTLGVAGATTPAVYNLQNLTLNGNSELRVVGPVTINLANSVSLNTSAGSAANPTWLQLDLASGGLTLNGNATLFGSVNAPNGAVIVNGSAVLQGSVAADALTINGNAEVRANP